MGFVQNDVQHSKDLPIAALLNLGFDQANALVRRRESGIEVATLMQYLHEMLERHC